MTTLNKDQLELLKITLTVVRCYDENTESELKRQFAEEMKENFVPEFQIEDVSILGEVQGVIVISRLTEFSHFCYREKLRDQISDLLSRYWEFQESFSVCVNNEEIYDESDFDYDEVHRE